MTDCKVTFTESSKQVVVPYGTLISDAAQLAGLEVLQPCGGQGRCGRCAVQVLDGSVRRRSTLRLSAQDIEQGYALACQSVVESNVSIYIPPQEKIERRLTTDLTVAEVTVPPDYDPQVDQSIQRVCLRLKAPSMDDQTDDLSRLTTALRQQFGFEPIQVSLSLMRKLGSVLRQADWQVTALLERQPEPARGYRLIDLLPGRVEEHEPIWAAAIDIGTTTVTLWLVDLISGKVKAQVSEYNAQIARGEDVISRIVSASKEGGKDEMRNLALTTINQLAQKACQRVNQLNGQISRVQPDLIVKAVISGNSTMMHLLLGIPADSIRLTPFVTAVNQVPILNSGEIGLGFHPEASVDCLPGVASYVGADITAGVLSAGLVDSDMITLFMDVGTNGEIVLGSREWLVTCACSAGPAFEGAGVRHGMRATQGAIEEVWINADSFEPSYRVIGGTKPRGICGSGLIALLAELFMTGVIDKAGNLNTHLEHPRVRGGESGWEYVVAWGAESALGEDIVITHVDMDNLIRAKAAIYAGYSVLADSVGVSMDLIERMLIGGSFGKYINVEKAVQIGLLPDLPWERFEFLGNTAVKGAYLALLQQRERERIREIASRMTYIELSADNTFYEAFMSALFLPHTEMERFPSVMQAFIKE
jgi:uncharacterized 2Fe-2S/4Fe-4S cluster protein (DUF4445 family)